VFTRLLFILWNAVRSLIEAAIQASCVWSVVDFFSPISWTRIFWKFAVIQGLVFLAIIFGRLPQMATPFVKALRCADLW
jgi:hypothetical protein